MTAAAWSVALEEDVLLLRPAGWAPAHLTDKAAAALAPHVEYDVHPSVLCHATALHARAGEASAELARARARLDAELRWHDLAAAGAGTHPFATDSDPTPGLRVRVAVPDAEDAVRALDGIRRHLPALLALSGNSPFRRGRDTGCASSRVGLLSTRAWTGIPPAFGSYAAYTRVVTALSTIAGRPPATAIRWDARLQPASGTLEVGVLDAQTRVDDAAALAALVQCLVRMHADPRPRIAPTVSARMLDHNRRAAARDGMDAALAVDRTGIPRPVRLTLEQVGDACLAFAEELGCIDELIHATQLMAAPGAQRQRALFAGRYGGGRRSARLRALTAALNREFISTDQHQPHRRIAA